MGKKHWGGSRHKSGVVIHVEKKGNEGGGRKKRKG